MCLMCVRQKKKSAVERVLSSQNTLINLLTFLTQNISDITNSLSDISLKTVCQNCILVLENEVIILMKIP